MHIFKIALRNTSRQVRRTSLLSGAIAFGIMIIILLNSLTNGLTETVKENVSQALAGHIYITASEVTESGIEVARVSDDEVILEAVESSGIEYTTVSHRTSFTGTLSLGSKKTEERVTGIDIAEEQMLLDSLVVKEGSIDAFLADGHSIILSEGLARSIRAEVGDEILIRLVTQTGQNNLGEFTLDVILPDEGSFGSDRAYAHLGYVNELVNMPADASETINITLVDMDDTSEAALRLIDELEKTVEIQDAAEQREAMMNSDGAAGAMIDAMRDSMGIEEETDGEGEADNGQRGFGGGAPPMMGPAGRGRMFGAGITRSSLPPGTVTFKLNTIDDYTGAISQLVSTLNYIGYAVFAVLLLITMVGITNTYRMMMLERIKEIGTMRAMGVHRKQVRRIFLYEAGITACIGAAAGLVVSLGIMLVTGLLSFPEAGDFTMLLDSGHVGYSMDPGVTVGLFIIIVLFSMLAASSPAGKAARVAPAEALRTTK